MKRPPSKFASSPTLKPSGIDAPSTPASQVPQAGATHRGTCAASTLKEHGRAEAIRPRWAFQKCSTALRLPKVRVLSQLFHDSSPIGPHHNHSAHSRTSRSFCFFNYRHETRFPLNELGATAVFRNNECRVLGERKCHGGCGVLRPMEYSLSDASAVPNVQRQNAQIEPRGGSASSHCDKKWHAKPRH
jgi:hypothetical protein